MSEAKLAKSEGADTDLYDAAIEPSGKSESAQKSGTTQGNNAQNKVLPSLGTGQNSPGRRYCCYVGNMTWWTTDVDLQTMILSCGATNLIDIKFYENRNNGQSKGFALAVFTAESSVKTVMDKLPQKMLHGQPLVVLPYTKSSLAKFEDATRRVDQRNDKKDSKKEEQKTSFVGTIRIGMPPQPLQPGQMSVPPPVPIRPQVQVPPPIASMRPPTQVAVMLPPNQQPPQMRGPPPTSQPLPLGALGVTRPPVNLSAPPPALPQVQLSSAPSMSRPPPGFGQQPPQQMPPMSSAGNTGPTSNTQSIAGMAPPGAPPTTHPPPSFPPPGAHINPQVYRQSSVSNNVDGLTDAEFEEIMNRNRTVSSSAITRAVSDAAANDFTSAIETLVTAISLIRQSRVANDDRCKVLVSSLQHRSTRDRSRSPSERSRKRHRRSSRSRSRSRERYDYSPRHSSSSGRRAY
ncbi:unnamed protein product [Gongylonema pulchrum]|uniref:RRM domain-containing protein n=1 Tax=Gongylonema pulchrum TaxID=637853 RepID=A0A183EBN7_9BILA|nr:unnamed protein product [Gongylonema pulchrum]